MRNVLHITMPKNGNALQVNADETVKELYNARDTYLFELFLEAPVLLRSEFGWRRTMRRRRRTQPAAGSISGSVARRAEIRPGASSAAGRRRRAAGRRRRPRRLVVRETAFGDAGHRDGRGRREQRRETRRKQGRRRRKTRNRAGGRVS